MAVPQPGVQSMEATTIVWTRSHLIIAYILVWFIRFFDALQQGVSATLAPHVASSFQRHSMTPAVSIMSHMVGGLWKLTLAKVLDVWGRPQGYLMSVVILALGMGMMSVCRNMEMYAAAQVFYAVGDYGLSYTLCVFIADTSSLRNRGLMLAFSTSPYIITAWINGLFANKILTGLNFRLGYVIFVIALPIVTGPLFFILIWNYRKAKRRGLVRKKEKFSTLHATICHYLIEFDMIGLTLLTVGLALVLLPFNLQWYEEQKWYSTTVILCLVVGMALLFGFVIWERLWAPVSYFPYELLTDPSVAGACCLSCILLTVFYLCDAYFLSFLLVVHNLHYTHASFITSIYLVGSCLFSLAIGLMIRYTGRHKPPALFIGVPLMMVGTALMLHFRQPNMPIGLVIMVQIMVALAGGCIQVCAQMAVMCAVPHQYFATVLAIQSMFGSVGGAVGLAGSLMIWSRIFPERLLQNLPDEALLMFPKICDELEFQRSYPLGSPVREAVNRAYTEAQRAMVIVAIGTLSVGFVCIAAWRDVSVKQSKQVEGTVM